MRKERDLIRHIRQLSSTPRIRAVVHGIGDDCAVLRLPPASELLVTTDLCLENVHFRRAWHPAAAVGHRCLARGLSDIAAMGGRTTGLLSLPWAAQRPCRKAGSMVSCAAYSRLARRFKVNWPAATFPPPARSPQTSSLPAKSPLAKPCFARAPAPETGFMSPDRLAVRPQP